MIKLIYDAGMDTYYLSGIIDNDSFSMPVNIKAGYAASILYDTYNFKYNTRMNVIYIKNNNRKSEYGIYVKKNISNFKNGEFVSVIQNDIDNEYSYIINKNGRCYKRKLTFVLGIDKYMDLFYQGKEIDINSDEYFYIDEKYNDFYGPLSIEQAYNNNPIVTIKDITTLDYNGGLITFNILWKAKEMPDIEIPVSVYTGQFHSDVNVSYYISFRDHKYILESEFDPEFASLLKDEDVIYLVRNSMKTIHIYGKEYNLDFGIFLKENEFNRLLWNYTHDLDLNTINIDYYFSLKENVIHKSLSKNRRQKYD